MKSQKFAQWWKAANSAAKRALAKSSGSSYGALSNTANGHKNIAPARAARIEAATGGALKRGELCEVCRQCVYYKKGEPQHD